MTQTKMKDEVIITMIAPEITEYS